MGPKQEKIHRERNGKKIQGVCVGFNQKKYVRLWKKLNGKRQEVVRCENV